MIVSWVLQMAVAQLMAMNGAIKVLKQMWYCECSSAQMTTRDYSLRQLAVI